MKIKCLGSSSSGNCYLLQFSNDDTNYQQTIMVECGFSKSDIMKKSVVQNCVNMFKTVRSCLITHEHNDHAKAIKELQAIGIHTYASNSVHDRFKTDETNQTLVIGNTYCIAPKVYVYCFQVEHDAPESMGFIIQCQETMETILFVNDCKYFKEDLSAFAFDYIFIECNYIDKITRTIYEQAQKENDLLKIKQYKRVIDSHMGLNRTKKILSSLDMSNCKGIFLMHLSDRNANEYKMKKEITELIRKPTFVCQRNGGIK